MKGKRNIVGLLDKKHDAKVNKSVVGWIDSQSKTIWKNVWDASGKKRYTAQVFVLPATYDLCCHRTGSNQVCSSISMVKQK